MSPNTRPLSPRSIQGGRGRGPARQRREGEVGCSPEEASPPLTPTLSAPGGGEGDKGACLTAELEDVGGFLGIGAVAVEPTGHGDDVGRGGAGALELAVGQGQVGGAAGGGDPLSSGRIDL